MFEPVRGGTRGGQAEFKWSDVSADKDRENYLGHSINAPTGRWQKNKDVHWYSRDTDKDADEKAEEIRKVKELEADALAVALGFEPTSKNAAKASGSNAIPVASTSGEHDTTALSKDERREEKRRRKEERKEERRAEKRARKELKKMSDSGAHSVQEISDRPRRHPSRSRSPRFRSTEHRRTDDRRPRSRSRSLTPDRRRRNTERDLDYDDTRHEREKERERNRPYRRRDSDGRSPSRRY